MVSVERPSEIGTPRWNGPQQRQLPFALNTAEIKEYRENGFLILRNVFQPEEIETYRQEAEQIVARAFALSREFQLEPKYNLRFEMLADGQPWKIDPFVSISPLFSALARDRRIMDRLASLYDGYEAVLFKDKLIFKPPDSHGNGLHQDYNWWQGFPQSLLTVSVALDASTKENGCTELWTGHHQGFMHEHGSLDQGSIAPERLANEEHVYVDLAPGDIAIFTCFYATCRGIQQIKQSSAHVVPQLQRQPRWRTLHRSLRTFPLVSDTSRSYTRSGTVEVLLSLTQFDTPHIPDFSHP